MRSIDQILTMSTFLAAELLHGLAAFGKPGVVHPVGCGCASGSGLVMPRPAVKKRARRGMGLVADVERRLTGVLPEALLGADARRTRAASDRPVTISRVWFRCVWRVDESRALPSCRRGSARVAAAALAPGRAADLGNTGPLTTKRRRLDRRAGHRHDDAPRLDTADVAGACALAVA